MTIDDGFPTRFVSQRALVVADEVRVRDTCIGVLRQDGFECEHAASAEEADAALASRPFDLVLVGVSRDAAAATALVAHIRDVAGSPGMIAVTGLPAGDASLLPLHAAGCPVLFDPIDQAELSRTVAWVLQARHVARAGLPPAQIEALYRMATLVTSEPHFSTLLDRLLGICIGALDADGGSIMLASAGHPPTLSVAASYGMQQDGRRAVVPFGEGVCGWVAQHRKPLRLVGGLESYPQFAGLESNARIVESLVAPVVYRREVLGTISVNARVPGRLGPEKLALLMSAADVAAAAVHRDRLERSREHQDQLAMLGQLSASVAHELNNPLAYVKANVELITQQLSDPAVRAALPADVGDELSELTRETLEGVERMAALVANLKSASRKPTGQRQPLDLNALLERTRILVHPRFKHRVNISIEQGKVPEVYGDQGRLLQVLLNLAVNAAQAVGSTGRVVLRTRGEGEWAIVEVEDTGPGIPPEVAQHLFEPFFTTKPEGEGTGLGLSISRQIAVEHGGELTFESEVGKGTCFRLRLPAKSRPRRDRPVVLVVDDEPALLKALVRTLQPHFEVLSAANAADAVRVVEGKTIDVVLTDFSMPGENGVHLVRRLRERGHTAPAALLTAVHEDEEIRQALGTGVVRHVIAKPWSPSALVAEVARLSGIEPEGPESARRSLAR